MADEDDDLALGADMGDDEDDEMGMGDPGDEDDHEHGGQLEGEDVGGGWVATGEVESVGEQPESRPAPVKKKAAAPKKPAAA